LVALRPHLLLLTTLPGKAGWYGQYPFLDTWSILFRFLAAVNQLKKAYRSPIETESVFYQKPFGFRLISHDKSKAPALKVHVAPAHNTALITQKLRLFKVAPTPTASYIRNLRSAHAVLLNQFTSFGGTGLNCSRHFFCQFSTFTCKSLSNS